MSERNDRLQAVGAQVIGLVNGLTQALHLYAPNNAAVKRLVDELDAALGSWFRPASPDSPDSPAGEALLLQIVEDECFINGQLLKVDAASYQRVHELSARLHRLGWSELAIGEELTRADIDAFVADLAENVAATRPSFLGHYGALALGNAEGSAVASFRHEPERLAAVLHSSLLALVERLFQENAQGNTPSLFPLRRVFQMVIDNVTTQEGIWQLLAAARPLHTDTPIFYRRTTIAVEAAAFGSFLGLRGNELMTLALAGILAGLSPSREPDASVRAVFRYPGIGTFAVPVTLAIHGARRLQSGAATAAEVPPSASLLALVEAYESACMPVKGARPMTMGQALAAVMRGRVRGADPQLARLFGYFKGRFPLGSVLELDDGRLGIVVAFEQVSVARPTLLMVSPDGELGETLALSRAPERTIAAERSPESCGLNLATLRSVDPAEPTGQPHNNDTVTTQ